MRALVDEKAVNGLSSAELVKLLREVDSNSTRGRPCLLSLEDQQEVVREHFLLKDITIRNILFRTGEIYYIISLRKQKLHKAWLASDRLVRWIVLLHRLQLIETVDEISQEDVSETAVPMTESGEGTIVRCSYTPVAISANMKSELASFLVSPITPLKLLVPINYPAYSPEILEMFGSESSMDCEDLSAKAKSKLKLGLQVLHQPMSLTDIAKTWDTFLRAAISEFAQKLGGGNFCSTNGTWKSYPSFA